MSARAESQRMAPSRVRDTAGMLILVALGSVMLMMRARLLTLPPGEASAALALLFGGILTASLLVPVAAPGPQRLHPAAVLTIGGAAVILALFVSGRPLPVAYTGSVVPLVILGAIAEEALFRRVAYAAMEPAGAAFAIVATSLLFAAIHLPLYGVSAFPLDLGAGLLFGWQRWASGTWAAPATTHAMANVLLVMLR